MKFADAIPHLLEGKKIWRSCRQELVYFEPENDRRGSVGLATECLLDPGRGVVEPFYPTRSDLQDDDWEVAQIEALNPGK